MALIHCPECGNEVSSEAKSCPRCGHPISAAPEPSKKVVVAKEGCFLQTLNAGCIILFSVIALIVLVIVCSSGRK